MLTDVSVKALLPLEKPYKRSDANGLYLYVTPSGGKLWRFKFRFAGKEKLLALGSYPEVSVKQARELRDDARTQLRSGTDPTAARRALKLSSSGADSFETLTREWLGKQAAKWTKETAARIQKRLESDVLPWLGRHPVGQIKPAEVLAVLRRIEARGAKDTAHRAMQECSQIFRYGVATGRAERDPVPDLRGALAAAPITHHASITEPKAVGGLMRAIEGYKGQFISRCALKLAPLVFVRPGELRHARWTEFDLGQGEWRIPAERMKMWDPLESTCRHASLSIL